MKSIEIVSGVRRTLQSLDIPALIEFNPTSWRHFNEYYTLTYRAALKMSKLTNDGTVLLHFCAQLSEYIYNDNIQLHPE